MLTEYYLDFPCCIIKIEFKNFDKDIQNLFECLYGHYINSSLIFTEYNVCLTKIGEKFLLTYDLVNEVFSYYIHELCNVLHVVFCKIICQKCNENKRTILHAATFKYNDKNIILVGKKSSGKTTSLVYFLNNGAIYLGEEILEVSNKGIIPYALPIKIKSKSLDLLKESYRCNFQCVKQTPYFDNKKFFLLFNDQFKYYKIDREICCDIIIFTNESYAIQSIRKLNKLESFGKLLKCIRNNIEIESISSLINKSEAYDVNFSNSLENLNDFINNL